MEKYNKVRVEISNGRNGSYFMTVDSLEFKDGFAILKSGDIEIKEFPNKILGYNFIKRFDEDTTTEINNLLSSIIEWFITGEDEVLRKRTNHLDDSILGYLDTLINLMNKSRD